MNLLILSNNYHPELTGPAGYITDLAEYLTDNGDSVTVLTSAPHYPRWKVYDGYKNSFFRETSENGVRVIRCPIYIPRKPTSVKRIGYDLSYSLSALFAGLPEKDYDLVYCVSPPLTIGISAEILAWLKRAPFIFHIMDLIPETAAALGMLSNKRILRVLYAIEKHVYRKAAGIVAITPGFLDNIISRNLTEGSKVRLLPNWVEVANGNEMQRGEAFRAQHSIPKDNCIVTYAGNIGNKQGLNTLVEAAVLLNNQAGSAIKFIIAGDGAQKAALYRQAQAANADNITFLPPQNADRFSEMMAAADVFVITQKNSVVDICLPSKLLTNCAAGKPTIASVNPNSETAQFVRNSRCGTVCPPELPESLRNEILTICNLPDRGRDLGQKGREFVTKNFNKTAVLQKYRIFIHEILAQSK